MLICDKGNCPAEVMSEVITQAGKIYFCHHHATDLQEVLQLTGYNISPINRVITSENTTT